MKINRDLLMIAHDKLHLVAIKKTKALFDFSVYLS